MVGIGRVAEAALERVADHRHVGTGARAVEPEAVAGRAQERRELALGDAGLDHDGAELVVVVADLAHPGEPHHDAARLRRHAGAVSPVPARAHRIERDPGARGDLHQRADLVERARLQDRGDLRGRGEGGPARGAACVTVGQDAVGRQRIAPPGNCLGERGGLRPGQHLVLRPGRHLVLRPGQHLSPPRQALAGPWRGRWR